MAASFKYSNPRLYRVGKFFERQYKARVGKIRRLLTDIALPYRPGGRSWRIDLPLKAVETIQIGTLKHTYRGHSMLKNPFEVALYPQLFWQVKPRTVIEIGSLLGVSGLWFADLLKQYQIDGRVISVDIDPPSPPEPRDNLTFLKGDANALDDVLTPELLAGLSRPWLVIEDSSHTAATTTAVLEFFAPLLCSGEYIVIEDGSVSDLGRAHEYGGGPGLAISRFLARHPEFQIDAAYCDRYGHNVTGNPNGYLRRI